LLLFAAFLINYQYVLGRDYSGLLGRTLHYGIITAIVLVAACSDFRQNNPLVFIGDNSYTVYLIHPTILDLSFWLFNQWGYGFHFHWWMCAIAIAASLLAGIVLGKVERGLNAGIKKLRAAEWKPAPFGGKSYVAWFAIAVLTVGCFVGLKGFSDIQKRKRENFSSYASAVFDSSLVEENGYNPGWVDHLKFEPAGDGSVAVSADGWAYDPIAVVEISQIAVLANGESVPVSVAWYDRPGVGDVLGVPVPVSCGFTLKVKSVPIGVNLSFYGMSKDGYFLPLACVENAVTG